MTRPDLKAIKEAAEAGKWRETKPLEWHGSWGKHTAECVFGVYLIKPLDDGNVYWFTPDDQKFWASSVERAKAAAQADHEQRTRNTLANPTAILSLIEYVEGLEAKAATVLEADEAFRRHLPEGTERDPVTLACDDLRAALNGGAS